MVVHSKYVEEQARKKPFASIDPSDPPGFLEKVFEVKEREGNKSEKNVPRGTWFINVASFLVL